MVGRSKAKVSRRGAEARRIPGRLGLEAVCGRGIDGSLDSADSGYNSCCMITQSKVRKVGNSLGSILPKEVIADLKVQEGSVLYFTEAPDGVRITAQNPEFAQKLEAATSLSQRYRNALRELAK